MVGIINGQRNVFYLEAMQMTGGRKYFDKFF